MNSDDKPHVTIAPLRSYGWQRRVDLDTSMGQVWESPDGKLMMYPHGTKPVRAKLGPLPKVKPYADE